MVTSSESGVAMMTRVSVSLAAAISWSTCRHAPHGVTGRPVGRRSPVAATATAE